MNKIGSRNECKKHTLQLINHWFFFSSNLTRFFFHETICLVWRKIINWEPYLGIHLTSVFLPRDFSSFNWSSSVGTSDISSILPDSSTAVVTRSGPNIPEFSPSAILNPIWSNQITVIRSGLSPFPRLPSSIDFHNGKWFIYLDFDSD